MNLNPKLRNVIIALIVTVGGAFVAAYDGQSTYHTAIVAAIGAVISAVVGYLTPQGAWQPNPPAPKPLP